MIPCEQYDPLKRACLEITKRAIRPAPDDTPAANAIMREVGRMTEEDCLRVLLAIEKSMQELQRADDAMVASRRAQLAIGLPSTAFGVHWPLLDADKAVETVMRQHRLLRQIVQTQLKEIRGDFYDC